MAYFSRNKFIPTKGVDMPVNAVKIAISLPKEDFKLLETLRKRMGVTRSAFIYNTIHYWLVKSREDEMIKRYEEGYRRKPEFIEERVAMEKLALELWNKEEKW